MRKEKRNDEREKKKKSKKRGEREEECIEKTKLCRIHSGESSGEKDEDIRAGSIHSGEKK